MAKCPSCHEAFEGVNFCPSDGARLLVADRCELSPLVGQVIDKRYRVLRKVGDGASAEVFYAEHIHLKKQVALKVLRAELAGRSEAIERFQREAQAASGIGHPNIVKVEDFCILEDGSFYLAMEWLEGETLGGRLVRGPMPIDDAIAIARQVCSGLEAAHQVSIIHRDLKPANIFLQEGPRGRLGLPTVKILDFGIAKFTLSRSHLTRAGVFLGTPYYVSPEQAQARPIDHRADLYSMGVIMYQMVTGTVPFDADSALGVLQMHVKNTPQPPRERAPDREISPELEAIIMRCMNRRPEKRYSRASDLERALAELESLPTSTLPGLGARLSDLGIERPPPAAERRGTETDAETLYRVRQDPDKQITNQAEFGTVRRIRAETNDLEEGIKTDKSPRLAFESLDDAESAVSEFNQLNKTTRMLRSSRPSEDAKASQPPASARIRAQHSERSSSSRPIERRSGIEEAAGPRGRSMLLVAVAVLCAAAAAAVVLYRFAGGSSDEPAEIASADGQTSWTTRRDDGGLRYQVAVTPRVITPGQPFTLGLTFEDFGDQPGTALLEVSGGTRLKEIDVPPSGRAEATCKLMERGRVEVTLTVERPGQRTATSAFSLCVGSDPAGPPEACAE